MNIYAGLRLADGRAKVFCNGVTLSPRASQKKRNYSPDGFDWGDHGNGPTQLALAILMNEKLPTDDYLILKRKIISQLPRDAWTLTGEKIRQFLTSEARARKLSSPPSWQ